MAFFIGALQPVLYSGDTSTTASAASTRSLHARVWSCS
jgi:hypothetical protein